MRFMITKYNNANEVLFAETELRNYLLIAYEFMEEEVEEEVLVLCHASPNLTALPNSTEVLVESDNEDFQEDGNLGLFDGFQEFMQKCV